jgi:hypothetical protein
MSVINGGSLIQEAMPRAGIHHAGSRLTCEGFIPPKRECGSARMRICVLAVAGVADRDRAPVV